MTTTATLEHWKAIAAERRALADDLDGLSELQWQTPSLCSEWTVRQLVGHLVVLQKISVPKLFLETAKARGNFDRANSKLAIREGVRPTADLVADLRRLAEGRFTAPGFSSSAPLTDILIHSQDIRLPLGLPSEQPVEPYRHVLDLLVTKKARGAFVPKQLPPVRFAPNDLDWSFGEGDTVAGTAANIALAMTGRVATLDALSGAGQPTFAAWTRG
jgi:uncharacterized protein (TIGR03083 family)